jgi:1,4-dihydroxy-2-naphthoate octaprenyltransferase
MSKLRAWIALSRPPFHIVGILPFLLGTLVAWRLEQVFSWQVLAWGVLGVVLILLATYYAGEYWDVAEDALSGQIGGSRFSGGSQVVQRGLLSRAVALWASLLCLLLAGGVGLLLSQVYGTGMWTLPLGAMGAVGGFFYSTGPVRWVKRGWGELWIAFCYGWLPVAVGCYLQTGLVPDVVHWVALPIGLSIFNVILLNEFPDHAADLASGKTNLAVRLGLERSARLYALVSVGTWIAFLASLTGGVPKVVLLPAAPVALLSCRVTGAVLAGRWRDRRALERLCAANLAINLGVTASYIPAFVR